MAVQSYRELVVWQKAMDLVEIVYQLTRPFPDEELYGLTSQLPRAAVSIASNIAEGQGRQTTSEFLHFLSIASGSLKEVETQVLIAQRLRYLNEDRASEAVSLTTELGRMISGLVKSLRSKKP